MLQCVIEYLDFKIFVSLKYGPSCHLISYESKNIHVIRFCCLKKETVEFNSKYVRLYQHIAPHLIKLHRFHL